MKDNTSCITLYRNTLKGAKLVMKKITKGLVFASLLALGTGASAVPTITSHAADTYYGFTNIGSSVVEIRDTAAQLYDSYGDPLGQYLPMGSKWKTSLENTLGDGSYYGVATDEYVKATDVNLSASNGTSKYGQTSATNYDGVSVTNADGAAVYDINGDPVGKTLPVGSDWKIDLQNNLSKGTFYRVATDEYLSANDVRVYQNTISYPENKDITTRPGRPAGLYDHNGQYISERALGPNTSWYTDEFCDIGHIGYYRVSTDEFVRAVDVY